MPRRNPRSILAVCLAAASLSLAAVAQQAPRPGRPGDITGLWTFDVKPFGRSKWRFVPMPDGTYHAQQIGFLAVTGRATVMDRRIRIDWTKANLAGYCEYTLDETGAIATGKQVNTQGGGLGSYESTLTLEHPGLIPRSEASLGAPEAYWWCTYGTAVGPGASLVRLYPGGLARSDNTRSWDNGKWSRRGEEIWIDWGLGEKNGDQHYVLKLAVSPDARTLKLSPSQKDGNYYVRRLEGVRLEAGGTKVAASTTTTGTPRPAGGSEPGTTTTTSTAIPPELADLVKLQPGEQVLHAIGAMQLAPPPLALPAVGAEQPRTSQALPADDWRPPVALLEPLPLHLAAQSAVQVEKLTATHAPGASVCDRGNLKVEFGITAGARAYAGVYVGGYIKNVSRIRRAPGYRYLRRSAGSTGPLIFPMPQVLPAEIRVELYDGATNALLQTRKIEFNHDWPNYTSIGVVSGDRAQTRVNRVSALVQVSGQPLQAPGKSGVFYRFHIPHESSIRILSDPNLDENSQRAADALRNYYALLLERSLEQATGSFVWDRGKTMSDVGWAYARVDVEPRCGGDRDERDNVKFPHQPGMGWDPGTVYKLGF